MFTISTPGELKVNNWLSEVTIHIIIGAWIEGITEDGFSRTFFNDTSRLVFSSQEEGTTVGNALCLLHVVGHDNDSDRLTDFADGLLNASC